MCVVMLGRDWHDESQPTGATYKQKHTKHTKLVQTHENMHKMCAFINPNVN